MYEQADKFSASTTLSAAVSMSRVCISAPLALTTRVMAEQGIELANAKEAAYFVDISTNWNIIKIEFHINER